MQNSFVLIEKLNLKGIFILQKQEKPDVLRSSNIKCGDLQNRHLRTAILFLKKLYRVYFKDDRCNND